MTNYYVKLNDGYSDVHAPNPIQQDYTLCGSDIGGDDKLHEPAISTTNKITCKHCITIIKSCHQIKLKDLIK